MKLLHTHGLINTYRVIVIGVCIACIALSAYAVVVGARGVVLNYTESNAYALLNGTAQKPYIYRTLVPTVANVISALTPKSVEDAINDISKHPTSSDISSLLLHNTTRGGEELPVNFEFRDAYRIYIVFAIMFTSLLGYAYALYLLGRELFLENLAIALLAPVIGLVILPSFLIPKLKIYDFTQLMLMAFCLYAIASHRLRLYISLFALACINKETSIFLTFFFVVWFYDKLSKKEFLGTLSLQIILFTAIKLYIDYIFIDRVSSGSHFLQPRQVHAFLTGYSLQTLLNSISGILLVTYRFSKKPLFLRYAFISLFMLQYPAYFFFCAEGEYRDFFEIFPVLTLLGTHTLVEWSGIHLRPIDHKVSQKAY